MLPFKFTNDLIFLEVVQKYGLWCTPFIGFIGTVIGICSAFQDLRTRRTNIRFSGSARWSMRKKIFHWFDKEFVLLFAEGRPAKSAVDEACDLFQCFDDEFKGLWLSFDNTVRTRFWGLDRENRNHN